MPNTKTIVINTGPTIALVAAVGDFSLLELLYDRVLVPFEVCQEILAGGDRQFAVAEFEAATWLQKWQTPLAIAPFLLNSLDIGEAAVIQLAMNENIKTVCIDETTGRRIAKLSGLSITGSIGILLRAKREGYPLSIKTAIQGMRDRGIRLSESLIAFALEEAGED
ncbi:MAG: DUF3368 domain-containing protein [Cyanobacteriota bacterium]|nr:DUF3368 domain-containing protein [Cyanobacteriota bacterium]